MTWHFGILLALACALATNLAFLLKHRGARAVPLVDVRRPVRSAASLFGSRWFAIGMLVALGAWALHVAALALAPLSVVQAVLSAGVVLLAVLAERGFGMRVGRRQWAGVALTACGLALLAITLPASGGAHASYSIAGIVGFEGALIALGALLVLGPRIGAGTRHHGVTLGAAAGVLFGVSDIAIKALTGLVGMHGIMALLAPWTLVAVVASVAAFYASARSLQEGDAVPVIALTTTAANVSCIAGGIVVFGDPFPTDVPGIVAQSLAFGLVCLAAALMPAPVRTAAGGRPGS